MVGASACSLTKTGRRLTFWLLRRAVVVQMVTSVNHASLDREAPSSLPASRLGKDRVLNDRCFFMRINLSAFHHLILIKKHLSLSTLSLLLVHYRLLGWARIGCLMTDVFL